MNFSKPRYKGHSGRSSSFKRPIHYMTHDKDGVGDDRVGFVALLNLATDDPAHAAREMQTTVDAAKALQERARIAEGKRPGASGKDVQHPVYAFTLSWHPSEKPGATEMLRAAQEALKVLGLKDHQAVIAEHRDRPHTHVHVVVSIVHPETGRVANLRHDERKLDRWAHQYEKEQAVFRSFKRAAKHDPALRVKDAAQKKADNIRAAKARRIDEIKMKHATAKAVRQEERDNLWKQYKEQKQAVYDKYKDLFGKLRQPSPALNLKPPSKQADPAWMELAKAMKPANWVYERSMNGFRHAVISRVPHNTQNATSRNFAWSRDAKVKEDLQPLKRQLNLIQAPGRTWLARKERSNHLKTARNTELAELALAHLRRTEGLEKIHSKAEEFQGKDWEQLKAESAKIWANWRAEFKQPEKQYKEKNWGQLVFDPGASSAELKPEFDKRMGKSVQRTPNAKTIAAAKEQPKPAPEKQHYRVQIEPDEAQRQFAAAIRDAGLDLKGALPEMDGKIHYVPLIGDKATKKSGAYKGYTDGHPAGRIWNYKTALNLNWKAEGERVPVSREQATLFAKKAAAKTAERNAATKEAQDNAALKARLIVEQSRPASADHPYLVEKGVEAHGILQDADGKLVIPLQDKDGRLRNVQTIARDGTKLYMKDAQKTGTFYVMGHLTEERPVLICEGFATASTLREATGYDVVVALDSGNLKAVALAIRENFPQADLFVCGDDDKHLPLRDPPLPNVGREKAEEAAIEADATVIFPQFAEGEAGTDFNDFAKAYSLDAVVSHFPALVAERAAAQERTPEMDGPSL